MVVHSVEAVYKALARHCTERVATTSECGGIDTEQLILVVDTKQHTARLRHRTNNGAIGVPKPQSAEPRRAGGNKIALDQQRTLVQFRCSHRKAPIQL